MALRLQERLARQDRSAEDEPAPAQVPQERASLPLSYVPDPSAEIETAEAPAAS